MRAPRITITCDCGAQAKVAYGDRYTCSCGRSWSTDGIPAADYERIRALDRRFRLFGYGFGAAFALLLLFLILTNPFSILMVTPGTMLIWFAAIRPTVRRRQWRKIQALTRSWKLRAEGSG